MAGFCGGPEAAMGSNYHPTKPGCITVPGKPGDELAAGTLSSVLKAAGLKGEKR